jgi:hypothetical protein
VLEVVEGRWGDGRRIGVEFEGYGNAELLPEASVRRFADDKDTRKADGDRQEASSDEAV